jgi:predicted molibdopterin-dependent oxidoreductase YjgC
MKNVVIKTDKKKMTIEVDLTKEFGLSKSGKSITIASTEGNHKVEADSGEVVVGLNVYKPAKGK